MPAAVLRAVLRGLLKEPAYLAVRVVGLAVGVATACLALAFVRWELGFDRDVGDAGLAMTSYASRRRAREIAVRRVLGTTLPQALLVVVRPYLRGCKPWAGPGRP